MKIRKRAGLVAMAIFGLPWAAVSVAALVQTNRYIQAGNWNSTVAELAAAVATGLIGFGLLGVVAIQWKWMSEMDRLQATHPDQQWLWRSDWAAGRADDSGRRKMRIIWLFAILLTGMSAPLFFVVPKSIAANHNDIAVLSLVLPAAGIGLIYSAINATKRWRKFGQSSFVMTCVPCAVCRGVVGTITFQKTFQTGVEFSLELTCIRRARNNGSDGRTRMNTDDVWSDIKKARLDAGGTVPVEFQLPANALETDIQTSDRQITWRLNVDAPVPGTACKASFDVPVFKV